MYAATHPGAGELSAVTARLQTLCGCTQFRVVDGPVPSEIVVPITAEPSDDDGPLHLTVRRFKLVSVIGHSAEYVEVPEGL